jgi:integrase
MAKILKRCDCPERAWKTCLHSWVVSYRTPGGRAGRKRQESFGQDKRAAEDFALKVEHDKRARIFIDPKEGEILFRQYADTWLSQRIVAESTAQTYSSVLRTHVYPAFGVKKLNMVRRRDIKDLVAEMREQGLSASRIHTAHLVINAIFNEALRDKKLSESPCLAIELPDVVAEKDLILPTHPQIEELAAGLPTDWAATVWFMHGCGLRIGEALAVNVKCRIADGRTLRVNEQVNPAAQLRPLKFRKQGEYRDIPLPQYVSDAIDKHVAEFGTTADGYLFKGRRHKHVVRNSYQQDFRRSAKAAGLTKEFVPHSLRHVLASTALAKGIPITEVSRWLGHKSIEVTHRIYGHLVPSSWDRARHVLDEAFAESQIGNS